MKNLLNYYYGIIISKIDSNGYFQYANHLFCLYEIKKNIYEIETLFFLNMFMIKEQMFINKIIMNNYQKIITSYNKKNYVLIEITHHSQDFSFPFYLAPLDERFHILKRNDWANLWSMKVDYLEKNRLNLEKKSAIIYETIDYYIGLSENAILYFKMLNLKGEPLYIEHHRMKSNDVYNPLELVLDYKVRDLGEYLKDLFFHQKKAIYDLKNIVQRFKLNHVDYLLLYTRLLYPSYYFDLVDEIMLQKKDIEALKQIVSLSGAYEQFLYEIYLLIKRKYPIIGIDWLNKK